MNKQSNKRTKQTHKQTHKQILGLHNCMQSTQEAIPEAKKGVGYSNRCSHYTACYGEALRSLLHTTGNGFNHVCLHVG